MKNFRSVAGRLLPVILLFALPLSAQSGVAGLDGSWDAVVVVGQAEIPFRFEISPRGAGPQGFFFEGENEDRIDFGKIRRWETAIGLRVFECNADGDVRRREVGWFVSVQSEKRAGICVSCATRRT